jgi:hypothetical protein
VLTVRDDGETVSLADGNGRVGVALEYSGAGPAVILQNPDGPVRRITITALLVALLFFSWSVIAADGGFF